MTEKSQIVGLSNFNFKSFIIICLFIFLFCAIGYSQDLPDVETKIVGESIETDNDAIPDFTPVLPPSTAPMPMLPSIQITDTIIRPETKVETEAAQKENIFLEGRLGAGWPGFFVGEFSVYQNSGKSPFSVYFSHESLNGYGLHKPEDGFSDSLTSFTAIKRFVPSEKITIDVNGSYASSSFALQGKSPVFYSVNSQRFAGSGNLDFKLPNGFSVGFNLSSDGQTTFGSVSGKIADGIVASKTLFFMRPEVNASWSYGTLKLGLTTAYQLTALFENQRYVVNRGDLGLSAHWTYNPPVQSKIIIQKISLDGSGNAIITDKRTIVPFSISVDSDFSVPFGVQPLSVFLNGGISSVQTPIADILTKYPYVSISSLPVEESDAFFDGIISVPFSSIAVLKAKVNYAQTVWGNGVLRPDFDIKDSQTGFFIVSRKNRTKLTSNISFDLQLNIFSVGAGWQSSWLDRVENEVKHSLFSDFTVHAPNGKWGASADIVFNLASDFVPEVGLSAFYRINNSFSLEASFTDIIKLVTATDRVAFSPYLARGGIASLNIKLFF